jgi:hypothetical protein
MGLGLLSIDTNTWKVTVLAEPLPYRPRPNQPQRRRIMKEHSSRKGDPTAGGSTRQPIMTAYRQRALACAFVMREGPKAPRELKHLAPDAGTILLRNVYGWFERSARGLYRLTPAGKEASEALCEEAGAQD